MSDAVALFGGGRMGEALLAGLRRAGREVLVVEPDADRAAQLAGRYDVRTVEPASAVAGAGIVLLAVKPYTVADLLGSLAITGQLVISVAAGVTTATMAAALPPDTPVVRCMPNTPALVGEGITAIAAGAAASEEHLAAAQELLGGVGAVVRVAEEQLDAVTALSGSGPAYFFAVVEAMVDAGVLLGLPRPLALQLVTQTAVGAGVMLRDSKESPTALREAVTSPGGTTAAALRELDERGLRATLAAAVEACARRSRELGA